MRTRSPVATVGSSAAPCIRDGSPVNIPILSPLSYPGRYLVAMVLLVLVLCLWPFNFRPANGVSTVSGGIHFSAPATAWFDNVPLPPEGWTFLLQLTPDNPGEAAWIAMLGIDLRRHVFMIGQHYGQLVVDINGVESDDHAAAYIDEPYGAPPTWVALVADTGTVIVYVNGVKRGSIAWPSAAHQQEGLYPLVLGCLPSGKFPWSGTIHAAVFLRGVVGPEQIRNPMGVIGSVPVLASCGEAGQAGGIALSVPEVFRPWFRPFLQQPVEYWVKSPLYKDVSANILLFVPVGILIAAFYRRRALHAVVVAALISLLLSSSVEMLQVFLPSRWSSAADVASNTTGGIAGALMVVSGLVDRIVRATRIRFRGE